MIVDATKEKNALVMNVDVKKVWNVIVVMNVHVENIVNVIMKKIMNVAVIMMKKNTQNFVNIPFGMFLNILEYKLKGMGVHLEKVDESYTSKSSFIDKDEIPTYEKNNSDKYNFSGKRIKRGLKNPVLIFNGNLVI